jgi:hypothetical protein
MTTPQQDSAGFEPDMYALTAAARSRMHNPVPMGGLRSEQIAEAVITEYRKQLAAAGYEIVSTDLLERYQDAYMESLGWHKHGPKHYASYPLAAAQQDTAGEDEG